MPDVIKDGEWFPYRSVTGERFSRSTRYTPTTTVAVWRPCRQIPADRSTGLARWVTSDETYLTEAECDARCAELNARSRATA